MNEDELDAIKTHCGEICHSMMIQLSDGLLALEEHHDTALFTILTTLIDRVFDLYSYGTTYDNEQERLQIIRRMINKLFIACISTHELQNSMNHPKH
jgi:hypothetical protein